MDECIIDDIYNNVFRYLRRSVIDIFLCGGASNKNYQSNRDKLKKIFEKDEKLEILYPEDLFIEFISKKKNDLLSLEKILADNSDVILIVCESPGAFAELGAFSNNDNTIDKVIVLVQTKYKNEKSFIMLGPVNYIQRRNKKKVIFYNQNIDEEEKEIRKVLRIKEVRDQFKQMKDINSITGLFYFILLLLFFYDRVETAEFKEQIYCLYKRILLEDIFDKNYFEYIYGAAIGRSYKKGFLKKYNENKKEFFMLTDEGYKYTKKIMSEVNIANKVYTFNQIRMQVMRNQYC